MRTMNVRSLVAGIALSVLVGAHLPLTNPGWIVGPPVFAAPSLSDLKGVDELKTLFNRDAGRVRLVLLVSPT